MEQAGLSGKIEIKKADGSVVTLTNCLNKVSQLRGVEFDWKNEYIREVPPPIIKGQHSIIR